MSLIGTPIQSFSDSLGVLMGLQERFGLVHAVFLLDADSRVVDGWAVTERPADAERAVAAGLFVSRATDVVRRALLLSAGVDDVLLVEEADLERWRRYLAEFAAAGVELVDWLASDGVNIRSFAITADAESAWVST
jgi:hypothetical protein